VELVFGTIAAAPPGFGDISGRKQAEDKLAGTARISSKGLAMEEND
jgi:hypothetical protein